MARSRSRKKPRSGHGSQVDLGRWRIALLILGGVACLVVGGLHAYRVYSRPRARAVIEKHWVERSRSGSVKTGYTSHSKNCYLVSYQVGGKSLRGQACTDTTFFGRRATVLYDPDDPTNIEFDEGVVVFKYLVLWIVGGGFAWFIAVMYGTDALETWLNDRRMALRERGKQ